jgi:hypothetical protein
VELKIVIPKEKPLALRFSEAALRFLKQMAEKMGYDTEEAARLSPREALEREHALPSLEGAAADLLLQQRDSFVSILLRYLKGEEALGRAEYLFLVYLMQRQSYLTNKITRERFTELLQLHQELFRLFHSRFPDKGYLLGNLNAYARTSGINNDVLTALEKILATVTRDPAGISYNPDLVVRNLAAMLRESELIKEVAFSNLMSQYNATLVPLAARSIYRNEPGSAEAFEDYLAEPMSVTGKGDWFTLKVISTQSGFWAVLELERIIVPLSYRNFASFTASFGLKWIAPQEPGQNGFFTLELHDGIRLCLPHGDAAGLWDACNRIQTSSEYRSHDRIWSLLYGTVE